MHIVSLHDNRSLEEVFLNVSGPFDNWLFLLGEARYTIRFTHTGILSVVVAVDPAVGPWQLVFRRLHTVFPLNTSPVRYSTVHICTCSRKLGLGSATVPNLDDDDGPMLKGWALPLLRVS